ncbi:MAG: DUF2807 domain-containing protein, partial [Prevotellaceae bacterium]|nr:DUF2807 domain-containing protein [Prevotellaceae bacterium]
MKKILLIGALAFGFFLQACAGNITTENRVVNASFDEIVSNGATVKILLTQGNTEAVSVETEAGWQKDINVEVKDGRLKISTSKEFKKVNEKKMTRVRCTLRVTFKNLSLLQVGNMGDVKTTAAITSDKLDVRINGMSDAELQLNVRDLSVDVSGMSEAKLRGVAEKLEAECSGMSDLEAKGLKAEKVKVDASGMSEAEVYASKDISI